MWVSAYYADWMQDYLPPSEIDYGAVTHILHFSIFPKADGTLNTSANRFDNPANIIIPAVTAVHNAGKKISIVVGGWWSRDVFEGSISSANRTRFVDNLVEFMTTYGYDGIDIDMEDMVPQNGPDFVAFIRALRARLDTITPRPVLTTSVGWEYPIFAQLVNEFDQINLMTYDMSGAWPGWISWHNAPIYSGGATLPGTTRPLPSVDGCVSSMMSLGVPASKIGIGIDFYGYVWSGGDGVTAGGVTEPRQSWTTAPSVQANVPYYSIMDSCYQTQYYRWDSTAQAAFLSIDNPGSSDDKFISYDDQTSCQKKIEYVRDKRLGGVIIFELGAGYRANQTAGQRDPLLQAVKRATSSLQRPQ